ncbi:MAG: NlpC/P60 family protein [Hymenobacteraceae bacterium]|nr:NlpC/P60 family protein [Hymenobacteraceae bacterium]MDX5395479.1 NlpC/P60 family protein [Hymenobacteraceae bacterium]MDX5511531.1 NlpC/P60 family protein [Hymenobacteraceae bacterium]
MKHIVLCCLALASLSLSYFYEYRPAAASTTNNTTSYTSLVASDAIISGGDLVKVLETRSLTFRDTLFYEFHAQNFGLKLSYDEDPVLLETVAEWLGTPYRSGGNSKKGTDCSGFVTSVYRNVYGINLSRSSHSMFNDVERIKKDSLQTGDLVFFRRSPKQPIYHVGIYLKDGKFVHSATNGGVMISSLDSEYYRRNYYAGGRVN